MWLSKRVSGERENEKAENGFVTMSSEQGIETASSSRKRNIRSYAPYGYSAKIPVGAEVILIPFSEGQAAIGCTENGEALDEGEISIKSKGGAEIVLRNDGSVVINGGFVINKDGKVSSV